MKDTYILALDQGTTSSRALVFDKAGCIVSKAQKEVKQIFPKPGWVEHDPQEIWSSQVAVAAEALSAVGIQGSNLQGVGITNQRETTIVWDRTSGLPVYNAIVWQDRRTAGFCDELKKRGLEHKIHNKTGLVIDAYFSGSKIKWILDHVENAREKAAKGQLAFGTVDSWLVWKLTGGHSHITDVSNASRSMLFNIKSLKWDAWLLDIMDIPLSMMPEVVSSSAVYDHASHHFFGTKVPIAGMAGDQQAALFGQMCVDEGMVKNTYGTGCFILQNTGGQPFFSQNKLITTIAWKIGNTTTYALEGSIFIAGAVVQWLRDGLSIISSSAEVERLAQKVENSGDLLFVPSFTGMGAPYWDPYARGLMIGITRGTTRAHIARAALESIAFQTMDVLSVMKKDTGMDIKELRVDGGASANNLLMQFQADLINSRVIRPKITETTAFGAACLAGLATGFWDDIQEIKKQWEIDRVFLPALSGQEIRSHKKKWADAVKRAKSWSC